MHLLEIPRISLVYHNDPFLRVKKRFGLVADLSTAMRQKDAEKGKAEEDASLPDIIEENVEEEVEEEELEVEQEAPKLENSKE